MFGYLNRKSDKAYTLAEVLLVLVILAVMVLAMPPLTKKVFKVKTIEKKHGRFECYYNNSGQLQQYEAVEGLDPIGPTTVNKNTGCVFYPPSNVSYIMIHAVGGGGAGYPTIGTLGDTNNTKSTVYAMSYVNNSTAATWPDWFKYLKKNYANDLKSSANTSSYQIKKSFTEQKLLYGLNGQPGERVSMFFPSLSSRVKITMLPGEGAPNVTYDGGDTQVYFKYPSDDADTRIILARGGVSADSTSTFSSALSGGAPTDFNVGKLSSAKLLTSTFEDVLEDTDNYQKSKVNEGVFPKAGWGGNGSYFYLGGSALNGIYTYQSNNYSQSPNDSETTVQTDYWQTVTNKIPLNFYKRYGQTGNCTLTSGDIQISGSCYKTTGTSKYTCKIKDNSSEYTVYGDDACVSGSCILPSINSPTPISTIGSMSNCQFNKDTAELTCVKSSVSNAAHNCTYTNQISDFSCPEGITANTSGHSSGYGICSASRGGNGAVVILW